MNDSHRPGPQSHDGPCQSAASPGCDCRCRGMIHQRDVLLAAIEPKRSTAEFDAYLTKIFGSAFTSLTTDPGPGQRTRREWDPWVTATKQKRESQVEQRLVDVTLRDVLRIVRVMSTLAKTGWNDLVAAVTAHTSWMGLADQFTRLVGDHDEESGFFWSSMLAATVPFAGPALTPSRITGVIASCWPAFECARYPRANAGNTVKPITELTNTAAKDLAAGVIHHGWMTAAPLVQHPQIVLTITGALISADLWRHPPAVRNLLLPAVSALRTSGNTFSLDQPGQTVEQTITDILGARWKERGVW